MDRSCLAWCAAAQESEGQVGAAANNGLQPTALRAAAETKR